MEVSNQPNVINILEINQLQNSNKVMGKYENYTGKWEINRNKYKKLVSL